MDIGGSGIKAAVVDVSRGSLVSDRIRRETPRPARPGPMAEVVAELVRELGWKRGPIGCGFPGVVRSGVVRTARPTPRAAGQTSTPLVCSPGPAERA